MKTTWLPVEKFEHNTWHLAIEKEQFLLRIAGLTMLSWDHLPYLSTPPVFGKNDIHFPGVQAVASHGVISLESDIGNKWGQS